MRDVETRKGGARESRALQVAFGLKAHSGWAALVVLGDRGGEAVLVDRRRIDLVDEEWAKQPYHAAEGLKPAAARDLVKRGVAATLRIALREMRAAVDREQERENDVKACAVLTGPPMPEWSTEEILRVHFRMHKAEGALFRDALIRATERCGLPPVPIPERLLLPHAERALGTPASGLRERMSQLGKATGPPWGKDQKDAALAALVALRGRSK